MYKTFICIVFSLFIGQVLNAQHFTLPPTAKEEKEEKKEEKVENDTINQYNKNGKRTGYWRDKFEKGGLRYEGFFVDGKPVGTFKYYFPGGRLRAELIHQEKDNSVQATLFYRSGETIGEGHFVNQKKHGLWRYFNKRGDLIMKNYYHKGEKHGVWKKFFRSGELMEITTYHYGKKEGEWIQYYENGSIRTSAYYKNDKLHGEYNVFYENGDPWVEGYYINGLSHNKWTHYTEQNEIEKHVVYDKGRAIEEDIYIEESEKYKKVPERPVEDPYEDIFPGMFDGW